MYLTNAEHIAFIVNTEPLRLLGTEWEQYIMEGSNKADVISMGIHDLSKEPKEVLSIFGSSPAALKSVGIALLDKASPAYSSDIDRVNELGKDMPIMRFIIDSEASNVPGKSFKGGMNPTVQAAFDMLWTDMVTAFTAFLRVDANSNPNVKVVRQDTAKGVAKCAEVEKTYAADKLSNESVKFSLVTARRPLHG